MNVGAADTEAPETSRGAQTTENSRMMVPDEGIEPPTFGLQNRCSTAELIRQRVARSVIAEAHAGGNCAPAGGRPAPPLRTVVHAADAAVALAPVAVEDQPHQADTEPGR